MRIPFVDVVASACMPTRSKRMNTATLALACIMSYVLAAVASAVPASVQELSDTFASVAENASAGVVLVEVESKEEEGAMPWPFWFDIPDQEGLPDWFRYFFEPSPRDRGKGQPGAPRPHGQKPPRNWRHPRGQGSGFIISEDGYIITNNHVVENAAVVKVSLSDGRKLDAKVVGTDPATDIALLKIDATGLKALPLGDSSQVRVGEWVLALGAPFGLSQSVSAGIISARGRGDVRIVDYADFLQTDAAINPGNSGGPLVNLKGEVIGVNTAIYSRTGGYMGIGFAVPVNIAKYVVDNLRKTGKVPRGYLGILIQDLDQEMSEWFAEGSPKGILVADVSKDSPAEHAGIQKNDVIIELNGQPVANSGSFRSQIATTPPGTEVTLTILRGKERKQITVKLGELPKELAKASGGQTESSSTDELGITVQTLTKELADEFGYTGEQGVVVTQVEPGSPAEQKGIQRGDLIQEVNRIPVTNADEFERALKERGQRKSVLLLVRSKDVTRYVTIPIE